MIMAITELRDELLPLFRAQCPDMYSEGPCGNIIASAYGESIVIEVFADTWSRMNA